jgi:VWFA-related protein
VAVLVSTLFVDCAITPNQPQQVTPISQPATVSAPLRLCPANDQAPTEVRSRPGYVQIVASVSDASGMPVIRLKQSDFDIHDGRRSIQSVYFREDPAGLPVSVVILIDSSGSMLAKLPKVRTSLAAFLNNVKQCDEVAMLSFTSLGGVKVLQSFTTDHALLADGLAFVVPIEVCIS